MKKHLRTIDDWLWRKVFGSEDYMQLRPGILQRLRIAALLPFSFGRSTCPDPIFVVGCPRAGTTVIFEILTRPSGLQSFKQESHWAWELLHPPRNQKDYSPVLGADDLTAFSKWFIRAIYAAAFGQRRFVDKNPTNSFRIMAIREIFPHAKIVCVLRNGPDNVSSLVDAWRKPQIFFGFEVPVKVEIQGRAHDRWAMMLWPGWQTMTKCPLAEVCANQWIATNDFLLASRSNVPPEDWIEVRQEEIFNDPVETVEALYQKLGLDADAKVVEEARKLSLRGVNTLGPIGVGTWKTRNFEEVTSILPLIEPMMSRLGYQPENYA